MADARVLPNRLNGMAAATTPGANRGVFAATRTARDIMGQEGGVYRLKGRRSRGASSSSVKRVGLYATSNVREFTKVNSQRNVVGLVKGKPEGFWSIVQFGRRGGYPIYHRDARLGRARGALPTRTLTFKRERREAQAMNRAMAVGQGKLNVAPKEGKKRLIWIPEYGRAFPVVWMRQRVGPQGHPWDRTIARARRDCPRAFAREYAKPIRDAFKGAAGIVPGVQRYNLPIGRLAPVARSTFRAPVAP